MDNVNLAKKFQLFKKTWCPKILGELNGNYLKIFEVMNTGNTQSENTVKHLEWL